MEKYQSIPEEVYENLAEPLKTACSYFKEPHEKDMYLLSQLGLLGACFPQVSSTYDNRTQFPFINLFISAKAGMGKSVIMFARYAIEGIVTKFNNNSNEDESLEFTQPQFKKNLIISGNISASALLSQLEANDGVGIIFETEADTIANSISQDWGNFSDTIRKSTHHEPISLVRKKDRESINISTPKLSFILSGTPNQVRNLIPNTEDGTYSRFLFLAANPILNFRDGRPKAGSINLEQLFKTTISNQFVEIYNYFQDTEVTVVFTDPQWDALTNHWSTIFDKIKHNYEDYTSVIFRHSAMTLRIGMTLSIVRAKENGTELNSDLICTDQDFNNALSITATLQKHAGSIYAALPKKEKTALPKYYDELIEKLPQGENITRKEIINKWGIPERTADDRISRFIKSGQLMHAEYGTYQVVPNNETLSANPAKSADFADSLVLVNSKNQTI